jgi:hypothetical protein
MTGELIRAIRGIRDQKKSRWGGSLIRSRLGSRITRIARMEIEEKYAVGMLHDRTVILRLSTKYALVRNLYGEKRK